jgi:heat shock protein HslJ
MSIRMTVVALAVLAGALVSCGPKTSTSPAAQQANPDSVRDSAVGVALTPENLSSPSEWLLREVAGKPVAAPAEGAKAPSLVFEHDGNKVNGFAGCNRFSGTCEFLGGERLHFSMMAATRMACPDMTVEDEFLRALGTADSYSTDGKVLKLLRAKLAPLAVFEASGGKP